MKLQNLTIIFIIIIIPIVAIFTLYLNLETKTITLQTDYDDKLIEATKEAMEAFEINTVEWNTEYSSLANLKRQDLMSSINIFIDSLADKLKIGGISKETLLTYIPAIVFTMYDGYYIYSPTYVPLTITNDNGVQMFYYKDAGSDASKYIVDATQNISGTIVAGEPMYYYDSGGSATGTYNGISFTTVAEHAKKEYKHVLKTFVPYTDIYGDYTVNYTLDNYIRIYGETQSTEGYVIKGFGSTNTIVVPQNGLISGVKFNGIEIKTETLTENVYIRDSIGEEAQLKTYSYIYNSANDKRYYDPVAGKFFMINENYVKVYLPEVENVGDTLAEYKKVLVCPETTSFECIELYQLLNGTDVDWYYKEGNELKKYNKSTDLNFQIERGKDCSAINYYMETNEFNHWLEDNSIDANTILESKKQAIINDINDNLNLSISNYSENSKINFDIFQLTDEDWNQALSNISMITFFQGEKIGLKIYNNYAIATSTENNEYVSEDSLYYTSKVGSDAFYHRYLCKSIADTTSYEAYRNTDYKVKSYSVSGSEKYYYKHYGEANSYVYECFDCIVNRNNYTQEDNVQKQKKYNTAYYTALARERYVLIQRTRLIERHVHEYEYRGLNHYHQAYCECGKTRNESHILTPINGIMYRCIICNYITRF